MAVKRSYLTGVLVLGLWIMSSISYASTIVALGAQDALLASEAAVVFRAQLSADTEAEAAAITELEDQLRRLQARAQTEQLSADELERVRMQFEKTRQQFEVQLQALERKRAEREQAFIAEMRPKLDAVIRELIEEQGISVILNRQSTVYMEAGVDITPEVVKRLNAL